MSSTASRLKVMKNRQMNETSFNWRLNHLTNRNLPRGKKYNLMTNSCHECLDNFIDDLVTSYWMKIQIRSCNWPLKSNLCFQAKIKLKCKRSLHLTTSILPFSNNYRGTLRYFGIFILIFSVWWWMSFSFTSQVFSLNNLCGIFLCLITLNLKHKYV